LLTTFGSADAIPYFSKRFILSRYLQLNEQEIVVNEKLKREEMNIDVDGGKEDYPQIYGSPEEMGGDLGGLGGMPGGGFGGEELGMEAAGGAGGAEGEGAADTGGTETTKI